MTTYSVRHTTLYEYDAQVLHAHHVARLRPRRTEYQQVLMTDLDIKPRAHSVSNRPDYFGNDTDSIEVQEVHDHLEVTARSVVCVLPRPLADNPPKDSISWEQAARIISTEPESLREYEYSLDSPLVRRHRLLANYAQQSFPAGRPIVDGVIDLNRRINEDFTYDPAATEISTPLAQVLREKRGVCQDFAHVAIGCLRALGLPARYVSGYLETQPPEGQPRLVGADASHAWAAVYVPDRGWLDFDPTNNVLPSERHVTVAWGRDFSDVSPLKGTVLGGGSHRLTVGVDVEPRVAASTRSAAAL
jgi:transglutaminase-like putative cysteine protease